jgi:hypothetical protein
MPSLAQTLPSNDIGFLRIVASLWGIELTSSDASEAAVELSESLCDAELLDEVVSTLPQDGRSALEALAAENGRMPWVAFARRFGDVREMGAGKRDRERPHLNPNSAAEVLWYRALIAKAFFDGDKGLQEFAFIPDDFMMALDFSDIAKSTESEAADEEELDSEELDYIEELAEAEDEAPAPSQSAPPKPVPVVTPAAAKTDQSLGRQASPAEKAVVILARDRILDDACTLLAALRMGLEPPETKIPAKVLTEFLMAAKIIVKGAPQPEPVKNFLEAPRAKALEMLVEAWQNSKSFNELRQIPGLSCEGEWKNDPLETREFLLNLLEPVPDEQWWSIGAFVRDVKAKYPDYQRPAGDYDSWFIKREADGVFLRGFSSWDEVDGALIRYFFQVLHWLAQIDLAAADEGKAATSFRLSSLEQEEESGKIAVASNGRISVDRLTPRVARYQVARFCEWDDEKEDEYRYRVTPKSLKRAKEQGLKAEHLLGILRKHASGPIPPPFVKALQRWEMNGTEARVETLTVLKVAKPEILEELRKSKAARFLGEIVGPTTITIQSGAQAKVLAALAEMGLLAENQTSEFAKTSDA